MSDYEYTRHCFRCKGMVVIDPTALNHLPRLMAEAAEYITNVDDYWNPLAEKLRAASILVESVMQDG